MTRADRCHRLLVLPSLLLVLAPVLVGCGTDAEPSGPTGVDGLVIPTPDPDPADFVSRIDNPYLPLTPGTVWTYEVTGSTGSLRARTRTVTVEQRGLVVDGVETTVVRDVLDHVVTVDFYAQDTAGDVWWFGRQGGWRAGTAGAQAGLAMAAHPRLGDGYLESSTDPGGVRAEVLATDLAVSNPDRDWPHTVLVETTQGRLVRRAWYAAGVGVVRRDTEIGPVQQETLVSMSRP